VYDAASYEGMAGPVGRIGEINDIVDAILYLERPAFVTGERLHVDGGQAAGH
jgi:NAD(P)-dependent dehydrogenase (short-subunit alcohol dehydrogenase family)